MEKLNKPSDIYNLWIYDKDLLFDYLGSALWIDEVKDWYSQIIAISLNNDWTWVCGYVPSHALFMSRLRAHGMGEDIINKIMKAANHHGSLPKHPERLSYIEDEYIEYIFDKTEKPIVCTDNITEYFGEDVMILNGINRFDLGSFGTLVSLFQGDFYLPYIQHISPKGFLTLEKKQFERIFQLQTSDLKRLMEHNCEEILSTLRIVTDRNFNIAIHKMKHSDNDPKTFWDAWLL